MRTGVSILGGLPIALACLLGCSTRTLDPDGTGKIAPDASGSAGAAGAGSPGAAGVGGDGAAGGGAGASNTGYPGLDLGRPCTASNQCGSGYCGDGVCCNTDCARGCGTCASDGSCVFHPLGTPCSTGSCDGDAVVGQKICNGTGYCRTGPTVICAPYTCDPATAACRQTCATDADCVGTYCEPTGRCHVNSGRACTQNTQCASGFCADGFCCDTACNGNCMSCDVAGHQGTCWPRPDLCPGADAGSD